MPFPLINGDYYSYADIQLRFNGLTFVGVKAINYKDNLGRAKVRGTASVPLGLTRGNYEASGDVEMYLSAWAVIMQTFGAVGAIRQIPFSVSITYGPNIGLPIPLVTDIIPAFYLGELDAPQSEGEDALTRKMTMHIPGQILWSGVPTLIETTTLQAVA